MEVPVVEKTLHVTWGLPLNKRVYEEIGKLMVHILPLIDKVEIADREGAIIKLRMIAGQEEEIKKLRDKFLHINVWFEGEEDPEQIEMERLQRLFGKKGDV